MSTATHPAWCRLFGTVAYGVARRTREIGVRSKGSSNVPPAASTPRSFPDAGQELPIGGPPGSVRLVCAVSGREG